MADGDIRLLVGLAALSLRTGLAPWDEPRLRLTKRQKRRLRGKRKDHSNA
jgi:hypothetical protein